MSAPTNFVLRFDFCLTDFRIRLKSIARNGIAILLGFWLCLGLARAQTPQVPQGGTNTFPYTASVGGSTTGWIITQGGTTVSTTATPAGWTVGFTSPNFTVSASASATLATGYSVKISNSPYSSVTASFDVVASSPSALASVSVTPSTVSQGIASTGMVTLSSGAPVGGTVVSLSSGSALASVPASVSFTAGQSTQTFSVTTSLTPLVTASTPVTLTATAGAVTKTTVLTLNPRPKITMISPSVGVTGGSPANFRVTLDLAPVGGNIVVSMSSNVGAAVPPATATIYAGSTYTDVGVTTTAVSTQQTGTITATLDGTSKTGTVNVYPPQIPDGGLSISPNQLTGGGTVYGSVYMNGPAPAGGASISVSCSNNAALGFGTFPSTSAFPGTVIIPAGQTSTNFTLSTSTVNTLTTVTVTALYSGSGAQASLTLAPANLRLTALLPPGTLRLEWDSIALGTSFILKRKIGGGAFTTVATLSNSVRLYDDVQGASFVPGTVYIYELYDTTNMGVIAGRISVTKFVAYKSAAVDNQTADARVDLRFPGTLADPLPFQNFPFGARVYRGGLFVGYNADPSRVARSFARFNAPQAPPTGVTYRFGSIAAFCNGAYTTGNNSVSAQVGCQALTNTTWTGADLVWSNAPTPTTFSPGAATNTQTVSYNPANGAPGWTIWPLAQPVYDAVKNVQPLSVVLASPNETQAGWLYFAKTESDATKSPLVVHAWDYPTLISLSVSPSTIAAGGGGGIVTVSVNGIGIGDSVPVEITVNYDVYSTNSTGATVSMHYTYNSTLTYTGLNRFFSIGASGAYQISIVATCNGDFASLGIN